MPSTSPGEEVLRIEGGASPTLTKSFDELRSAYKKLSSDIAQSEQETASLQDRLEKARSDSVKAGLQARLNEVRAAAAIEKQELSQVQAAWIQVNQAIAQRGAAASAAPPPQAPPPTPPTPGAGGAGAGGGGGGAGFLAQATLAQLGAVAAQWFSIYKVVGLVEDTLELGIHTLESWIERGIQINSLFDVLQVGLAASIAQNYKVVDATGAQLTGLNAVVALKQTSLDLEAKITAAAFQSGTSIEAFTRAFRLALPFASQLGASLDQTVVVVQSLVTTATALGVPFQQAQFQIAEILRGNITVRTTLAREIGLTTEQVKSAKEQGTLLDLLIEKTQAYTAAQGLLGQTFVFIKQRAADAADVALKLATEGGFNELKAIFADLLDSVVRFDEVTHTLQFSTEALEVITKMRDAFTSFVDAVVASAPLIAAVFSQIAHITSAFVKAVSFAEDIKGRVDVQQGFTTDAQAEASRKANAALRESLDAATESADSFLQAFSEKVKGKAVKIDVEVDKADAVKALAQPVSGLTLKVPLDVDITKIPGALQNVQQDVGFNKPLMARLDFDRSSLAKAIQDAGDSQTLKVKVDQGELGSQLKRGVVSAGADSSLTLIPQKEIGNAQTDAAKAREEAELQVLGLKRQQLEVDISLAKLQGQRGQLGTVEYAQRQADLNDQHALLEVKEAQAKAAGDERAAAIQAKGSGTGSTQYVQAAKTAIEAQERVLAAQAKLVQTQAAGQSKVSDAQLTETRLGLEEQIGEAIGRQNTEKIKLQTIELQSGRISDEDLAIQKAAAELDIARQAKVVAYYQALEAFQARQQAQASGDNKAKEQAQKALQTAQDNLNKAVETEVLVRAKGTVEVEKATQATLKQRQALQISGTQVQQQGPLGVAEETVLAAKRAETVAIRESLSYQFIQKAEAAALVTLDEADLKVLQEKAKLELAIQEQQHAQVNYAEALAEAGGNTEARDVVAAQLVLNQKNIALKNQQLAVEGAVTDKMRTQVTEAGRVTEAIRQQVAAGGQLGQIFSVISEVASQFTSSISSGLRNAIQSFQVFNKLTADAIANFNKFAERGPNDQVKNVAGIFKDAFEEGGGGIKDLFKSGAALDVGTAVVGSISSAVQAFKSGGLLGSIMGGISSGAQIGGLFGPIGAGVGAAAGGLLGVFFGSNQKQIKKIVDQIKKEIDDTMKAFNSGAINLSQAAAQLQKERDEAVRRLSGKKGAGDQLKQITDQIDQELQTLKNEAKQIVNDFESQLRTLRTSDALQGIEQSIEDINNKVKKFLDAGGSALEAQQFLALSLQKIYKDTNASITDQEKSTIDLLQQEIDLQTQRAAIIKQANDQENQIRIQAGVVRVATPAQTAALQIRQIEIDKKTQLDALDRQMATLKAQTDGLQQIYGLTLSQTDLDKVRLQLIQAQTAETVKQIQAYKDFLSLNSAALAAALKTSSSLVTGNLNLPSVSAGGTLTNGGPIISVQNVNIVASPGMTSQQAYQQFIAGIKSGVGNKSALLNSVR